MKKMRFPVRSRIREQCNVYLILVRLRLKRSFLSLDSFLCSPAGNFTAQLGFQSGESSRVSFHEISRKHPSQHCGCCQNPAFSFATLWCDFFFLKFWAAQTFVFFFSFFGGVTPSLASLLLWERVSSISSVLPISTDFFHSLIFSEVTSPTPFLLHFQPGYFSAEVGYRLHLFHSACATEGSWYALVNCLRMTPLLRRSASYFLWCSVSFFAVYLCSWNGGVAVKCRSLVIRGSSCSVLISSIEYVTISIFLSCHEIWT